jgi:hypothetical protein
MESFVCSGCGAEPGEPNATANDLELEGWSFAGEHGERCPECVVNEPAFDGGAGLDALAGVVGATKKEE